MIKKIPFITNTAEDLHCLQASYMMIAKHFDPSFDIDMEEWARLTGFEKDRGTWAAAGLVWFKNHGYQVKHISLFDYNEFLKRPEAYLIEIDGEEVGQWAIKHTNIPAEVTRIKELLASNVIELREPTIDDIKKCMDDGYVVRINVNWCQLEDKDGFEGHAVTVTGYDDEHIFFHDPGLPAYENRKVTVSELEAAWADPNELMKEFDAIKLPGGSKLI